MIAVSLLRIPLQAAIDTFTFLAPTTELSEADIDALDELLDQLHDFVGAYSTRSRRRTKRSRR